MTASTSTLRPGAPAWRGDVTALDDTQLLERKNGLELHVTARLAHGAALNDVVEFIEQWKLAANEFSARVQPDLSPPFEDVRS